MFLSEDFDNYRTDSVLPLRVALPGSREGFKLR